ncbi:hypothetical protein H6F43_03950 [Leptolyngbya sp. FACHB-36]|uniref:hypothetical protein n=1 Tax=Leptolyngbya sp. FACHB-36 TaxID=2692808 RepID=UPI001680E7E5|nr:hypothetical protein [Leptolyngbya sp. FACHB-36]MBD2019336.1 hypothetical protein [Leptolyngbya sp. FACHB-36]
MHITDSLNATSVVTLPRSGAIAVGLEIPEWVDLNLLASELKQFYGDRFTLDHPKPPKKAKKR